MGFSKMVEGAVTVLGPYACNATGTSDAQTELEEVTTAGQFDTALTVPVANGLQFYVIHIASA